MWHLSILLLLVGMSCSVLAEEGASGACQQSLRAGDFDKAADEATRAIAARPGDREGYLCLGRAYSRAGRHADAIAALREAEKKSGAPLERMQALTLLGQAQQSSGAYLEARAAYQASLDIARAERNVYFQRANLVALGETLQAEKDFKGALDLYQQGMKLAANDNERADCHAHLAAVHHAMDNHDQAIIQQIKAVVMEERSGDLDHYVQANLDLGRYYRGAGQHVDAERTLNKLLEAVVQAGDVYWEAATCKDLAGIKRLRGKPDESGPLLRRALELANKIGASELAKEIEAAGKM